MSTGLHEKIAGVKSLSAYVYMCVYYAYTL